MVFLFHFSYESFMKVGESPFIQISEDSECLEDCAQFYERNSNFAIHALKQTEQKGMMIFLLLLCYNLFFITFKLLRGYYNARGTRKHIGHCLAWNFWTWTARL